MHDGWSFIFGRTNESGEQPDGSSVVRHSVVRPGMVVVVHDLACAALLAVGEAELSGSDIAIQLCLIHSPNQKRAMPAAQEESSQPIGLDVKLCRP